jgi:hypothetical protein
MEIDITRPDAHDATRALAIRTLASAKPGTEDGRADAALALMALWAISPTEAEFEAALTDAMSVTETDIENTVAYAGMGEFNQAAIWLLG